MPGAETVLGTVGIVLGTILVFVGVIVMVALVFRFPGGGDHEAGGRV